MGLTVGIPRALLYYYYYPMWRAFFEGLGAKVVLSGPSAKGVLSRGLKHAVDDICLPVKLAFGHVLDLSGKVDCIFMPRLISVEKREYICPKFLGLPDMVRRLPGLPPLIDVNVSLYKSRKDLYASVREVGELFTGNSLTIWRAYRRSVRALKSHFKLMEMGLPPSEAIAVLEDRVEGEPFVSENSLRVALIGHPYNIYDGYASMDLIKKLRQSGASVVTAENVSEKVINRNSSCLPKKLFWTLGRRMTGAASHYMDNPGICGIIHVAAFGCGPDSMTGELIERMARARRVPFLNLTIDEHTGEAGVITRLEAFLDMVRWRRCG